MRSDPPDWQLTRTHRVAVAGLGGIATGAHLPAYAALGASIGFEVVGGAEPDAERRAAAAAQHGIPVFETVGELLAAVHPDVLDVTVPHGPAKVAVIEEALAAGCHVLAQKPLAWEPDEAARLVRAAAEADRVLALNMQARWAPAFRAVAGLVRSGGLGELRSVSVEDFFPLPSERMVVEMGVHSVDLLRDWTGRDPVSVSATFTPLTAEGRGLCVAGFDLRGVHGLVLGQWHTSVVRPWSFRVVGSDAVVEGHDRFGTAEPAEVTVHRPGRDPERIALGYEYVPDAFAHALASLLHAVERGTAPPASGADHLVTLAACHAALRSARQGGAPEPVTPPAA